ncbi:MAG TPA: CPBP family intramembrane glutamic endopeptidase [Methylomirabilota bacterium]|jgi:membrane protease YdiL (CAAX protease family)|nr:CPBP family intramembrane glutamic endopeptidase [Methylomirabilota bacterium]
MSAEAGAEVPVEPSYPPARLNRGVTAAALAVLGVLASLVFWPSTGLDTLDQPELSLERVVTRDMDFRAAAALTPSWEAPLYALALSSDAEARATAIGWYEELVQVEGSPLAELYRLILLAEDGRADALQEALAAWTPGDEWAGRLATWARAAYGAEPPADGLRSALAAVRRELPAGWFADRLAARLASRLGDDAALAESARASEARGTPLVWRLRAILASETLLVALGAVALVTLVTVPGGAAARVSMAPIPPPWGAADGAGLFARGALGLVGVAIIWPFMPDRAWATPVVSAISAIPIVGYLLWQCGSWRSLADTFGLRVSRAALPALARAAVALVGLSTLADVLIELAGARLGVETHWTDGFQERLVWGPPAEVVADVLDSCVFAPVVEELLFRGVLYGTLRLRLGPLPATATSAALFALAHGYGLIGFVSVFVSGVLWALAYERTRSLLPGMLAHAASNVQATAIVLATLRF